MSEAKFFVCIKGDPEGHVFEKDTKAEVLKAADDASRDKQAIEVFTNREDAHAFFEADESKSLQHAIRYRAGIAKQARRIESRLNQKKPPANIRQIVQGIKRGKAHEPPDQVARLVNIPPMFQNM